MVARTLEMILPGSCDSRCSDADGLTSSQSAVAWRHLASSSSSFFRTPHIPIGVSLGSSARFSCVSSFPCPTKSVSWGCSATSRYPRRWMACLRTLQYLLPPLSCALHRRAFVKPTTYPGASHSGDGRCVHPLLKSNHFGPSMKNLAFMPSWPEPNSVRDATAFIPPSSSVLTLAMTPHTLYNPHACPLASDRGRKPPVGEGETPCGIFPEGQRKADAST
mmetsp:Transcript_9989/g.37754  ORF Transcript_9989/g.37754 Transcript_9989/m.37754 type:complete len:220 (+) Transcript_9989:893-1552(+)